MRETEPVRTATLSEPRRQAAVAARRYGVPPTMIATAARHRAVGDWRGACAAADIVVRVKPDALRRRYGAVLTERLLGDLQGLAPDLLRWHLPRCGHGSGELLAGLFVPLADYADEATGRNVLTLAAATPQCALDAGQRIILTVLEHGSGPGRFADTDAVTRALRLGVRSKAADRYSLVRHRMFWHADDAPGLRRYLDATDEQREITRLQDEGRVVEAWQAAGFELLGASQDAAMPRKQTMTPKLTMTPKQTRWLTALPVALPGLLDRARELSSREGSVVLRSGSGAIVLSGLRGAADRPRAQAVESRDARGIPTLPTAAWARPVDIDLLRVGALRPHELHPLVAAALLDGPVPAAPEPDEWLYRTVPFIEETHQSPDAVTTLWIQCGPAKHRIGRVDGVWQPLDHAGHAEREAFLAMLGGPENPCRQAARHLATGRHVIELIGALIRHGRTEEVRRVLHDHADAEAVLDRLELPGGGTVGSAFAALRDDDLRLRMVLAGATRADSFTLYPRRRARKGDPARTPR